MNLMQSAFLLSAPTQELLAMLFRQSKITGSVQINFVAAKLDLSHAEAVQTIRRLQELGLVTYEKYGKISLTDSGRAYGSQLVKTVG
ncbi:MAG: hypothetical protein IJT44_10705 [Clostridia bacterium]|nr:hypothetical protein [Clostridia bacterium]